MIKIKNTQLNNETVEALNNLIEMDINAKSAFRLMRIIKDVSSLLEDKVKAEKKIFDKYLEKGPDGNPIQATDEQGKVIEGAFRLTSLEGFNQEMNELMSFENNIQHDTINFDDLNLDTVKIKDIMKIDFLFS
jgi:hypothetical protein